jgi:hypothetical protein
VHDRTGLKDEVTRHRRGLHSSSHDEAIRKRGNKRGNFVCSQNAKSASVGASAL